MLLFQNTNSPDTLLWKTLESRQKPKLKRKFAKFRALSNAECLWLLSAAVCFASWLWFSNRVHSGIISTIESPCHGFTVPSIIQCMALQVKMTCHFCWFLKIKNVHSSDFFWHSEFLIGQWVCKTSECAKALANQELVFSLDLIEDHLWQPLYVHNHSLALFSVQFQANKAKWA